MDDTLSSYGIKSDIYVILRLFIYIFDNLDASIYLLKHIISQRLHECQPAAIKRSTSASPFTQQEREKKKKKGKL